METLGLRRRSGVSQSHVVFLVAGRAYRILRVLAPAEHRDSSQLGNDCCKPASTGLESLQILQSDLVRGQCRPYMGR